MEIQINKIKVDKKQPRKTFNEESLKLLAESILGNGLITPIDVDEDYVIIDGERRFRAHKLAGLKTIPVRIVKLKKDNVERLKRQLISDLQNEDTPTGERYDAIVRLWRMSCPNETYGTATSAAWCKSIGLNPRLLRQSYEYISDKEKDPKAVEGISAGVWGQIRSLPEEEREEIKKELKETDEPFNKIVEQKKEQLKERKEREKIEGELEEKKKELSKREFKIVTDRERLFKIRDEILQANTDLNKLRSNVKWIRKTKFHLNTPAQKDNFIKFIEGASERARNWANELDDLRTEIEIEIIKE
jgi:ParB family chromosome partitioning protein|tara:strand:+ start:707 stop:1615 length:909 start_codon:yes stop_codon:yes gene_type:complete